MRKLLGGLAAIAMLAATLPAVFAAVYSGKVEAVSDDGKQLIIKLASKDETKSFALTSTTQLTVDGKKAKPEDILAGQTVVVITDGKDRQATKVTLRTVKEGEPAAKPAAPKAAQKSAKKSATVVRSAEAAPGDWPQHRGPNRDNISTEKGLLARWPDGGPSLAFRRTGLGEGYSSVAVVGGVIYTLGTRDDDEYLFALSPDSDSPKWATKTGRKRNDGTGNGPRGTPTVDGEHVYALGANGDLVCAAKDSGDVVWKLNILQEFGGDNITWGISESVLIDGDRLICTPGGKAATMVALDKLTGKPIWGAKVPGAPQAAYSSVIAVDVGGVRQYVNYVHTGVVGVRANNGTPLWGNPASANGTANCSTPVAANGFVFTASGYGTGGALFRLGGSQAEVVYTTREMKNHHGGMVALDGKLYGFDEAVLTCLDLQSGKVVWQNRSVGKGSLTYADGQLYLRSENGPVALAAASPKGYDENGRFEPPDRSGKPSWSHPVVAGGKLYLRDQDTLLVYDIKGP